MAGPARQSRATGLRRAGQRAMAVLGVCGLVAVLCLVYATRIEPRWLRVRHVRLSPTHALTAIHLSDIHYKGDRAYLERVVKRVNAIPADVVCFTGDLVEDLVRLDESLDILSRVNKPLFGIPGNHDQWAHLPAPPIRDALRKTGGDWLVDTNTVVPGRRLAVCTRWDLPMPVAERRILLTHYPAAVDAIRGATFDLILAGHTHGGQVRLPLVGHLVLPYNVGDHDYGLFRKDAGPLYVSSGIGTYFMDVRFGCRPEIAVIEL